MLTTTKDNGIYIGQTIKDLNVRFIGHKTSAKRKRSYRIGRAISKYGADTFSISLIEKCDSIDDLNLAEEFWISYYRSIGAKLWNIKKGGNNHIMSEETKRKLSEANKGKPGHPCSEETKKILSKSKMGPRNPNFGKVLTQAEKDRLASYNIGRVVTDETKQKISKANMGNQWNVGKTKSDEVKKKISDGNKGKQVPSLWRAVIITDFNGIEIEFPSVSAAARTLGVFAQSISNTINGSQRTFHGYSARKK